MTDKAKGAATQWGEQFRSSVMTLLVLGMAALASITVSGFRSHANDADLQRVELESKARDLQQDQKFEQHLREAAEERLKQAEFRAKMAERMKIELER